MDSKPDLKELADKSRNLTMLPTDIHPNTTFPCRSV